MAQFAKTRCWSTTIRKAFLWPLLAAAKSNLSASDIRLDPGQFVQLGKLRVKTDEHALMRPSVLRGARWSTAFQIDSFYDDADWENSRFLQYADKIVIIGATAAWGLAFVPGAGNPSLSPAEITAHITSSILSEHFIVDPFWDAAGSLGVLLLIVAYVMALLPRLSCSNRGGCHYGPFVGLFAVEFGLLAGG